MTIGDLVPRRAASVFGEPHLTPDGATVVTVSRRGRGGDGAVGIFVISGSKVVWSPAVDADRIALIGVVTGFVAATLGCLAVLRRPPWPAISFRR